MESITESEFDTLVAKFESLLTSKYLYYDYFIGALTSAMYHNKISWHRLSDDIIDAFKYAICNVYHGGCEPEFETEAAWDNWRNFNMTAFKLVTEQRLKEAIFKTNYSSWLRDVDDVNLDNLDLASPFKDNTKPYYILINPIYGKAVDAKILNNYIG